MTKKNPKNKEVASASLTLGPLLFNWPPEKWRDFYFRIADEAPVDSVSIGEVVCSKRAPFFEPYLADVVERLEAAGKEVVHSTLALIMSEREMDWVRDIAATAGLLVEANDISACALLAGRPHAVGPLVNVYNEGTLDFLVGRGARRVCLPGELPASSIEVLAGHLGGAAELEVMVFGRLPLAISARCYHARSRGISKDNCLFVCEEDPDGMDVETIDGKPFLAVNGTQTLSHTYCCLVAEMGSMGDMGVSHFRLSPHDIDMVAVAQAFRRVLDGRLDAGGACRALEGLIGGAPISNGFYYGREGDVLVGARQAAE